MMVMKPYHTSTSHSQTHCLTHTHTHTLVAALAAAEFAAALTCTRTTHTNLQQCRVRLGRVCGQVYADAIHTRLPERLGHLRRVD